jgi:hypothetical protein
VSQSDPAKRLSTLVRKLRSKHTDLTPPTIQPEPADECHPLVHELVFSMLLWEASTGQAKAALRRIRESFVDYNELRICVPDEVAIVLGEKYPLAHERALRMRSVLNDIFQRQHAVTLKHLAEAPKREARTFLDSLEGMPAFVAARVLLVSGLGHGVPVDERLRDLLAGASVVDAEQTPEATGSWLDRNTKSEEALATHLLLQAWSDDEGHPPKREKKPAPTTPAPVEEKKKPKATKPAKAEAPKKPSKAKQRTGG